MKDLTNGEVFEAAKHVEMLLWMRAEDIGVPQTDDDLNALMYRWIAHKRKDRLRLFRTTRKSK